MEGEQQAEATKPAPVEALAKAETAALGNFRKDLAGNIPGVIKDLQAIRAATAAGVDMTAAGFQDVKITDGGKQKYQGVPGLNVDHVNIQVGADGVMTGTLNDTNKTPFKISLDNEHPDGLRIDYGIPGPDNRGATVSLSGPDGAPKNYQVTSVNIYKNADGINVKEYTLADKAYNPDANGADKIVEMIIPNPYGPPVDEGSVRQKTIFSHGGDPLVMGRPLQSWGIDGTKGYSITQEGNSSFLDVRYEPIEGSRDRLSLHLRDGNLTESRVWHENGQTMTVKGTDPHDGKEKERTVVVHGDITYYQPGTKSVNGTPDKIELRHMLNYSRDLVYGDPTDKNPPGGVIVMEPGRGLWKIHTRGRVSHGLPQRENS